MSINHASSITDRSRIILERLFLSSKKTVFDIFCLIEKQGRGLPNRFWIIRIIFHEYCFYGNLYTIENLLDNRFAPKNIISLNIGSIFFDIL